MSLASDAVGQDTSSAWQTETDKTLDRFMHGPLAAEKLLGTTVVLAVIRATTSISTSAVPSSRMRVTNSHQVVESRASTSYCTSAMLSARMHVTSSLPRV